MKFRFMDYRNQLFIFSAVLTILALFLFVVKGFNYGIDFKGGSILHLRFNDPMNETKIRETFGKIPNLYFQPEQLVVQSVGGDSTGREFIIQYPALAREDSDASQIHSNILAQLKALAPYSEDAFSMANVGPTVGGEMKRQGFLAAIISIIGILLYLAWRFEFQSATGAIVSLVHDLIVVSGFVCLIGLEFDITVLAALLTMLGYSVNDSIVILDRIRENRRLMRVSSFADLINDSINQTLGRTINTSVTTLFTLVTLLLFGGQSIHSFALTLTVGVFFGTYSSIFIAAPVLLLTTGDKLGSKKNAAA